MRDDTHSTGSRLREKVAAVPSHVRRKCNRGDRHSPAAALLPLPLPKGDERL